MHRTTTQRQALCQNVKIAGIVKCLQTYQVGDIAKEKGLGKYFPGGARQIKKKPICPCAFPSSQFTEIPHREKITTRCMCLEETMEQRKCASYVYAVPKRLDRTSIQASTSNSRNFVSAAGERRKCPREDDRSLLISFIFFTPAPVA